MKNLLTQPDRDIASFPLPVASLESPQAERRPALSASPQNDLAQVRVERRVQFGFRVGRFNFLVGKGCYCEVLVDAQVSRLPNSPEILAGLINVRGNLVPVYRLETLLDLAPAPRQPRYVLLLGRAENAVGIYVDEIPRRYDLASATPSNSPPALPASLTGAVKTGYLLDGSYWLDFDHEIFFDQIL